MENCSNCMYLEIVFFVVSFLFLCSFLYDSYAYCKVKKELDEYKTKDLIKSTIEEIVR